MEGGMAWVDNYCSQFFVIEKFKTKQKTYTTQRYHVSHIRLAKTQKFNKFNTIYW